MLNLSDNRLTDGEKTWFLRKTEMMNREIEKREMKQARLRGSLTPSVGGTSLLPKKKSVQKISIKAGS